MKDRKVLIDLSEYNELVEFKKRTPKVIIQYYWQHLLPTIIMDGDVPYEVRKLVEDYDRAKPEMERLNKMPKWILKLFKAN